MKRAFPAILFLLLSFVLINCSGTKPPMGTSVTPNVAGTWEFLAVSNNGGGTTGIEVALQEGTVLVNGMSQPSGNVSAAGVNQISFVCINSSTLDITSFGGNCLGLTGVCSSVGVNSVSGTAMSAGGPFNFTYSENGDVFTVTGMLGSDGQSFLNGTYVQQTGSGCNDNGSVTGLLVPKMTGVYTGNMTLPDGTSDSVTATASESSGNVTITIVATAPDNTTFTMTGPRTGNAVALQGQFGGQPVTYNGYRQVTHNLPSIYFSNATNSANPAYAGTLTLLQQP